MIDWPYFPYLFALLLAVPFLIYLRQFVYSYIRLKNKELQLLTVKGNSGHRLQAYERLTLFLERLKPSHLVTKFDRNLQPHEFLFLAEKTITEEFDYNASQQLYLTKNSWKAVLNAKNTVLNLMHATYDKLGKEANLEEFKTVFLMNYIEGEDVVALTIEELRKENLIIN